MAEQDIQIRVSVDGADQGATSLGDVTEALHSEATAATSSAEAHEQAASSMQSMARAGPQLAQRVQGVASAVQGLVSAVGSENRTAGMVASVAGATAQFAAMGATLGPAGAVIGGIIGFATAASAAIGNVEGLADAASRLRGEVEGAALALSAFDTARREGFGERASAGYAGIEARLAEEEAAAARDARIAERIAEEGLFGAEARTRRESLLLEEMMNEAGGSAARGGGGRGRSSRPAATDFYADINGESANDGAARIDEELTANEERHAEYVSRIEEMEREKQDYLRELAAEAEEEEKDRATRELEAEQEKQDAIAEMHSERLEQQAQNEERVRQESIAQQEEFMNLGMNVVGLMTDALGEIASGEKTAEEAFKGLAKSFLQMISQYTALKAATEFADAIASFARYDFSGGAQHLAAGVAFTAVSVATGVGAAAINTSKPAAPARPEADRGDSGGKGGGDVIINWNSPVVTAGTRDDLGRELGALVRAGDARYGAA